MDATVGQFRLHSFSSFGQRLRQVPREQISRSGANSEHLPCELEMSAGVGNGVGTGAGVCGAGVSGAGAAGTLRYRWKHDQWWGFPGHWEHRQINLNLNQTARVDIVRERFEVARQ